MLIAVNNYDNNDNVDDKKIKTITEEIGTLKLKKRLS